MNTATVKAANLKPGMVLIDPSTGAPAFEIDHKMTTPRCGGVVKFFGIDLDTHRYTEQMFRPTLMLKVVA